MLEINNCYNMDCLDGMRQMKEQGMIVDFLLTDIPYGEVNRASNGLRKLDRENADIMTFNLEEYLNLVYEVVRGGYVIFCGTEQVSTIRNFFAKRDCSTRLLIWEKTNPSPMNGDKLYLSGIECAVYAKKANATFNAFCKNTVFRHPIEHRDIHDTPKPLNLWYELLNDNTNEGQLVLDTCLGSFTTAVACHKLKRNYIGFELDKTYFDKGSKWFEEMTRQISFFD